jgi:autotransporter-associated beta strand protein
LFTQRIPARARKQRRLALEPLEDRVVPATDSWTGGAGLANLNWSATANWSLGRAPISGDNVVFNLTPPTLEVINDNLTTNPVLASLTVSGGNYTLGKNGSSPLFINGSLNIGSGLNTVTIAQAVDFLPPPTTPPATPQVSINVNSGSTLNLTGQLNVAAGVTLSKTQPGTLILAGSNTTLLGSFVLANSGSTAGGVVEATNQQSLGSAAVTINTNTQLQLVNSGNTGFNFSNTLLINGSGLVGDGGLLNASGTNVWSGPITMDSDSAFGVAGGTQLTITGAIGDNSTGHNLTKQGAGTLVFPVANTYRGDTTVNNGVLEIENPLALGAGANALDPQSGSPQSETIVNYNPTANQAGTLELNYNAADTLTSDPNAVLANPNLAYSSKTNPEIGFQVFNDILVLNGPGFTSLGALYNASGDNEWDGSVILGSAPPALADPTININSKTELVVSGVVSDPNQASSVFKTGLGELVFNDADTYRGDPALGFATFVEQGVLDIADSKALGTGSVQVLSGAALQMDVDSGFDGTAQRTHNRNLGFDSVTRSGPGQELNITGASGTFTLSLGGYSTSALSVNSPTLASQIQTALNGSGGTPGLLTLAGYAGQSVSYVTQDGNLYRVIFSNTNLPIQLMTSSTTGNASVTVNPIYGLSVANNVQLIGPGISTGPDTGALLSDTGINTWTGQVDLAGTSAIGVSADNQANAQAYNQVVITRAGHPIADDNYLQWDYSLTVTGLIFDGDLVKTGLGDLILPNANTYGAGTEGVGTPATDIQLGWITIQNQNSLGFNEAPSVANLPQTLEPYVEIDKGGALHLDPTPGNSLTMYNNFLVSGLGLTSPTYGLINQAGAIENLNGDNTLAGIIQLNGTAGIGVEQIPATTPNPPNTGFPPLTATSAPLTASQLTLTGYLWNYANTTGGLTKLGSRRLVIEGSGTYTGNVDVKDGVLLVQNDTALGAGTASTNLPTVTVENGAALELGNYVNGENVGTGFISENGGVQAGIQVYGEHLILNGSGDPTFNDSALTVLAGNAPIDGATVQTITVTGSTTGTYELSFNGAPTAPISATASAATVASAIAAVLPAGGSDEVIQTGNTYLVTFGGTALNTATQLQAVVPAPANYTGTFVRVDSTEVGTTSTNVAPVNDPIVATDSLWRGPVTLGNNTTVTVDTNSTLPANQAASRLIFEGNIGDNYPIAAPSSLTILGGGEVDLNGTNTYSGTTYVQQGVVSIDNPSALGTTGVSETQTLTLSGASAGNQFVLTFNGFNVAGVTNANIGPTGVITYQGSTQAQLNATASAIAAALKAEILAGAGSDSQSYSNPTVTVTGSLINNQPVFSITFGGSLVGFPLKALGAGFMSGTGTIGVGQMQAGAGGTVVENGSSLEVAGSFSVAGEPLILEGNGTTQDQQTISLTPGSTGSFALTFENPDYPGGQQVFVSTNPGITIPSQGAASAALAAEIQSALDSLSNIGGVGGSVTVTEQGTSSNYTVAFGGTLSGVNLPTMTATSGLVGGVISVATAQAGSQTIAGVPTQWFEVGPAPETHGQTGGNQSVSGAITAEAVDPQDPTVMYVATEGGGVWKSIDNGHSWRPVFDAIPAIQTLTVSPGASGTFTLSFTGPDANGNSVVDTTSALNLSSTTLAGDIQTALDALGNIGGVGGQVTVTASGGQYMITFNGTLAGAAVQTLAVNSGTYTGSITPQVLEAGQDPNFSMYMGAIAIDPANSNVIFVGTGQADTGYGNNFNNPFTYAQQLNGAFNTAINSSNTNPNDAFYGTGVYESTDGGLTWSLLVDNTSGINPITGLPVNNPVTNSVFINPMYGMAVTGIAIDPASAAGGTNNPTIYVSTGAVGGSGVGDGVVNGANGLDGMTTIPTLLPTGGIADLVNGTIAPGGTGQLAGVWRYQNIGGATTWYDLTDSVSGDRSSLVGNQSAIPATPGPDDDFRINFPEENIPNVVWTGVQVVDAGIANDGGEFGPAGAAVPIVYASLGTPGQWGGENIDPREPINQPNPPPNIAANLGVNAVYRCYSPDSNNPVWEIGDPGLPQDQVDLITINDPAGLPGDFTLNFKGVDTNSGGQGSGGLFPGVTGPMTFNINFTNQVASEIQTNLNNLSTIGGVGGVVTVVVFGTPTATQAQFTVTFGGTLSLTPLPDITFPPFPLGWTTQLAPPPPTTSVKVPGGGADSESAGEFPTYWVDSTLNGNVKFSVAPLAQNFLFTNYVDQYAVYAAVPNSQTGNLLGIYVSINGGESWSLLTTPPPEYMNGQGNYANSIVAVSNTDVYVGGDGSNLEDPTNQLFYTSDGGATWVNVSVDSTNNTTTPHNAVHAIVPDPDQNNIIVGTDGGIWQLTTVATTTIPVSTTYTWTDLNSNLADALVNGVSAAQNNPNEMVVGTEGNGLAYFSGLLSWTESDQTFGSGQGPNGGTIYIDPNNTNIVFAVLSTEQPGSTGQLAGYPPYSLYSNFLESTDGGKTWKAVAALPSVNLTQEYPFFPFLVDPLDSSRILVGGPYGSGGLEESLDGGATWQSISFQNGGGPLAGFNITTMAVAGYQGVFVSDPGFPDVSDIGVNVDDSSSIFVSNGTNLLVSKDNGLKWLDRTPSVTIRGQLYTISGTIQSITVNPANRDNVFVVTQGTPGSQGTVGVGENQIWETTDAGQNWSLIGGGGSLSGGTVLAAAISGLPDIPLWQLVVDPRNGNLYVGTDEGVYQLANAAPITAQGPAAVPSTGAWMRFGTGMPNVSTRVLQLDLSTNTLVAGTYGRGVYQLFLDSTETSTQPVSAAAVGLSGNSFWAGPVDLVGDLASNSVTVAADGTQGIPDGITAASINFVGPVSDLSPGSNPIVVKMGDGDVIFSGANIYGGLTTVGQGNLVADSLTALGAAGNAANGTTVVPGASLGLLSNLDNEQVTLNGNGISFDGHYLGALRNISGTNSFQGNVTLIVPPSDAPFGNDTVSLGADSGSLLVLDGAITGGGSGGFSLVKEGTGTIAFDSNQSTYTGTTAVYRGALQADASSGAAAGVFGPNSNTVEVLDGAQVQTNSAAGSSVAVANPLTLSGTGINDTGALLNVGGDSTWSGPITLTILPGFAPLALTAGTVSTIALGADAGTVLTVTGAIGEEQSSTIETVSPQPPLPPGVAGELPLGVSKVGAGTVALANANTFTGSTDVQQGVLDVQNPNALGARTTSGGLETIEQIVTLSDSGFNNVGTGHFTLSFDGKTAAAKTLGFGASASAVAAVLEGGATGGGGLFASAGFVGATVDVFQTPLQTTTEYAPGALTPPNQVTGWVYTIVFISGSNNFAQTPLQIQANGSNGTFASTSVVAQGAVDVQVDSTANGTGELAIDNALAPSGLTVSQYTATLNGDGPSNDGAMYNLQGANTWAGPIILTSDSAIGAAAGSSLSIYNVQALSIQNGGTVPPVPTLTKVQPGTVIFPSASSNPSFPINATFTGETEYSTGSTIPAAGVSIVQGGSLQVDASGLGPIELDGGTVSGDGSVLSIANEPPAGTQAVSAGGTIDPGDNFPSENFGQFTVSGNVALNSTDTVYVDLGLPAFPISGNNPPLASNESDVLNVTGTINLNNATLNGLVNPLIFVDPSTGIGDAYTVIKAGSVVGEFSAPVGSSVANPIEAGQAGFQGASIAYIDGVKFEVDYFTNRVDVIRELASVTMKLAPSNPTPVYGQDEQIVATLTQEVGAPNPTGIVVFNVVDPNGVPSQDNVALVNGVATLDLPTVIDGPPVEGGLGYTVTASYSGIDANQNLTFTPASSKNPVSVTVAPADAATSLSLSLPPPAVFSEPLSVTATVSWPTSLGTPAPFTLAPAGTVTFYADGTAPQNQLGSPVPLSTPPAGTTSATATYTTTSLPAGNHVIYAVYNPVYVSSIINDNYVNVSPPALVGTTVHQDGTTLKFTVVPPPTPVYGQAGEQFTVEVDPVAPGTGSPIGPTGSVTFYDNNLVLGTAPLVTQGGVTTATLVTAAGYLQEGATTITANYIGDSNFTGSQGATSLNVNRSPSSVLLTTTASSTPYGVPVTYTATVSAANPGGGTPSGVVYFFDGASIESGTNMTTAGGTNVVTPGVAVSTSDIGKWLIISGQNWTQNLYEIIGANPASGQWALSGAPATAAATMGQWSLYSTLLGDGSLNTSGVTTYTTSPFQLPTGSSFTLPDTQTIYAVYPGDGNFIGSTSNPQQQTITLATAGTTVSTSGASVYGQPVTLTATVAATNPGGVIPSGTVTFYVTELLSGTPTLVQLGTGTLGTTHGVTTANYTTTLGQLPVGTNQTITAMYSGDSHYASSTGTTFQTVTQDSTTTTLVTTGSVLPGQTATLTAQVSANSPGGGNPTGTVTFTEGTTVLGTVTLNTLNQVTSASLQVPASALTIGPNAVTATYSGDVDFLGSSTSITQVLEDKTSTTVATSLTPSVYGQSIKLTATITPAVSTPLNPTGTVTFMAGGTTLGSATVGTVTLGGVTTTTAVLPLSNIPTGANQTITAVYSGDSTFVGSSGTVSQTVNKDTTKTTLTSSATSVVAGQTIVLTAQVVPVAPGEGVPTGTVVFKHGATTLGTATLSNGVATLQTALGAVGNDGVTATYSGDANNSPSSTAITITVGARGARASRITLSSSVNPSVVGQTVTFTATIRDAGAGAAHTPTGTVSFFLGTTLLGYGSLSGASGVSTATFNATALPQGVDNIQAVYNGSGLFTQEKSAVLAQTVNALATRTSTVTLSALPAASSTYGQSIAFTATVMDTGSGASETPTGTVSILATSTATGVVYNLGAGVLSAGAAGTATTTVNYAALPVGSYTIVATYSGDGAFAAQSTQPPALKYTVTGGSAAVSLSSSQPVNSVYGQPVTFTASVTVLGTTVPVPGTVTFFNETTGVTLGTVTLNNAGTATLKTAALVTGSDIIEAIYNGSVDITPPKTLPPSATLTQVVNPDAVTMGLSSTTTSNAPVTITASVSAASPGAGAPTGTVSFYIDGNLVGTTGVNSNGVAIFTYTAGVPTGKHTLEAVYSGDQNFTGDSVSETLSFTIGRGT